MQNFSLGGTAPFAPRRYVPDLHLVQEPGEHVEVGGSPTFSMLGLIDFRHVLAPAGTPSS